MKIFRLSQTSSNVKITKHIVNDKYNGFFEKAVNNNKIAWRVSLWQSNGNGDKINSFYGFIKPPPGMEWPSFYTYLLNVRVNKNYSISASLFFNIKMDNRGAGSEEVLNISISPLSAEEGEEYVKYGSFAKLLKSLFGVDNASHIISSEFGESYRGTHIKEEYKSKIDPRAIHAVRLTSIKRKMEPSKEIYVYVLKMEKGGYAVAYKTRDIEKDISSEPVLIVSKNKDGSSLGLDEAMEAFNRSVHYAKSKNQYHDENDPLYIPLDATASNWDFNLNRYKGVSRKKYNVEDLIQNSDEVISKFRAKKTVLSQDFGGYYSGSIPEYGASYIGTSMVDASQIKSLFNKTDYAIQLVNRFDSSLLSNVSFIFNFSKSGAYGVYLSELDRAIKTSALKKKLESIGYTVEENEKGMLTAYSKQDDKSSEEIQADIDKLYQELESKGGTAFGINMPSLLNASKQDSSMEANAPPELWEWMAALHLGATIVHEAIHAKGHQDEGASESGEASFINWALPIINKDYKQSLDSQGKGDLYSPIIIGTSKRHAFHGGWYRLAQSMGYVPDFILRKPTGSDLDGRHGGKNNPDYGMAEWSKMMQANQSIAIENKLSRQYMSPLPKDLNQNHNSTEEQLRKFTRDIKKNDSSLSTENLLFEFHDDSSGYKTIEELMEEQRPRPLMLPISKKASMLKGASIASSSFGWYSNLSISDGSTIPGLSDRVMEWADVEIDFIEEEREIRSQPRYNPPYDIKGCYYRWIEPRSKPQLFDDMTRDLDNTHPAKRFASVDSNLNDENQSDAKQIFSLLSYVKNEMDNNRMLSMRFLSGSDFVPIIARVFQSEAYNIKIFDAFENIFSVWIFKYPIGENDIDETENYISSRLDNGLNHVMEKKIDNIIGISERYKKNVKKIIDISKNICEKLEINGVYIMGGYPKLLKMKDDLYSLPFDITFVSRYPSTTMKIGWMVANEMGIDMSNIVHNKYGVSFCYYGLNVEFAGNIHAKDIVNKMEENDIEVTPITTNVYNCDFTINMMLYDFMNDKIIDISGKSIDDISNKYIKTYFPADYICRRNPMVMLRAVLCAMSHDGFRICEELKNAIINNHNLLFNGNISRSTLVTAKEKIMSFGKTKACDFINSLGLEDILKLD